MQKGCPDCANHSVFGPGSGKCSKCYGAGEVGTIADDIAGGKRPCRQCHGTGTVALFQPKQRRSEMAARVTVVVGAAAIALFGFYEIRKTSSHQLVMTSPITLGTGPTDNVRTRSPAGSAGLASVTASAGTLPTFIESFNHAPDYNNKWKLGWNTGSTGLTYTPGSLRIQASHSSPYPPASAVGLLSKHVFSGDVELTIELNHRGYGQSKVGLFGVGGINSAGVWFDLDTDDLACLSMSRIVAGQGATTPICPSSLYTNRWVTLQISIIGQQASYYCDGTRLLTIPYPNPPGSYLLGFGGSSVPWKSGDNVTLFRKVVATATSIQ